MGIYCIWLVLLNYYYLLIIHLVWCILNTNIPFNNDGQVSHVGSTTTQDPAFYSGYFTTRKKHDTYLSFRGWGKGIAFVNEYNIGRYWPVKTLCSYSRPSFSNSNFFIQLIYFVNSLLLLLVCRTAMQSVCPRPNA